LAVDLGDGLVLRRATTDDVEAVAAFNRTQLSGEGALPAVGDALAEWTRDLLGGTHPAVSASDCTVIEDTRHHRIVSSVILISQTWTYDGVPFGVGRPELVATHPDYRRRGLIRSQFEVLHQWSAERGHLVQAITGIPWFYRQFGYEMCVDLDAGRNSFRRNVPPLEAGKAEPFRLRAATSGDVEFIDGLHRTGCERSLLSTVRDIPMWRYEMAGRPANSIPRVVLRIVETANGEPAGFVASADYLYHDVLTVAAYEIKPGVCWQRATPSVLRALLAEGDRLASRDDKDRPEALRFLLGREHPAFQALPPAFPESFGPYAFYMRVADLPAFLQAVRPVLNKRLSESPFSAFTGDVTLNFYRSGLMLKIDDGRVVDVQPWQPPSCNFGDARYPDLTFLSVLFGHRTTKELNSVRADCYANPDKEPLLNILFPRRLSCVWPLS
jgi:GNAT superfamily N-acetyltransferase